MNNDERKNGIPFNKWVSRYIYWNVEKKYKSLRSDCRPKVDEKKGWMKTYVSGVG